MYLPAESIEGAWVETPAGARRAVLTAHYADFFEDGAIVVSLKGDGRVVFSRPGARAEPE